MEKNFEKQFLEKQNRKHQKQRQKNNRELEKKRLESFEGLGSSNQRKTRRDNKESDWQFARMNCRRENEKNQRKIERMENPQIKSCFEPIVMAQKPMEGTFLENMSDYEVGLLNTNVRIGNAMFPANVVTVDSVNELIDRVFLLPKPTKREKGEYNDHKTVKPLAICEYLIKLSAFSKSAVILDPFVGSGTTAVAAKKLGKNYIGIDSNEKYVKIAEKRLQELEARPGLFEEKPSTQLELRAV